MHIAAPILIVLATCVTVVTRSLRITAAAIGVIYAAAGLLLGPGVDHSVVWAYVVAGLTAGAVVCLATMPITAKQQPTVPAVAQDWRATRNDLSSAAWPPLGWLFLITTFVFCVVIAHGLSSTYPMREVELASEWESFVAYWLLISGSVMACITRSPLKAGSGLLLLLCGASVSYVLIADTIHFVNLVGLLLVGIALSLLTGYFASGQFQEVAPEVKVRQTEL